MENHKKSTNVPYIITVVNKRHKEKMKQKQQQRFFAVMI